MDQMEPVLKEHEISAICEYIPFKQLKELRTVCKTWNNGILPILKQRSKIRLEFRFDRTEVYNKTKLDKFCSDLKDFKHYGSLKIRAYKTPPGLRRNDPYYKHITKICTRILQPRIKTLELIYLCRNPKEMDILEKIFLRFAPYLETLKKRVIIWSILVSERFIDFLGTIRFPKLKRIAEPSEFRFPYTDEIDSTRIYTQFYKSAPRLVALGELGNYSNVSFLKPLVQDITLLPNLNELHFEVREDGHFSVVGELKQKLKVLYLRFVPTVTVDKESVFKTIKNHKETLETLSLSIEVKASMELSLPACPKLKSLEMICRDRGPFVDFENGQSINYSEHFPSLQSLSVLHCLTFEGTFLISRCSLENTFNSFFPKKEPKKRTQIFQTLTKLKLKKKCTTADPNHTKCRHRNTCNNKSSRVHLARKMFPNAVIEFVSFVNDNKFWKKIEQGFR